MGKAQRNRRQSAREKIAAQQAAAHKAEVRRRGFIAGGSVVLVIVIVVVFVVLKTMSSPAKAKGGSSARVANATVAQEVTNVPLATLNSVGKGTASALIPTKDQTELKLNGKPEVLYVGAEYCPFCAAQRWAMATALSRFGTLTGLNFIHSSSTDEDPNTPTLSFYKSTYTSPYLTFTPVEWYSNVAKKSGGYTVLQAPTAAQLSVFGKYDAPPYVPSADKGSFPFVDFGNEYLVIGSQYQPTVLSGMTWAQVAAAMKDPSSKVAQAVDGAANSMTAALCKLTNDEPGSVCSAPGVAAASGNI